MDLAETVRAVAAGLGVTGRVVLAIPEGTVTTDRSRIVEILSYLLESALMHSPDRSAVTVCADSDKSGLRVWVDSRIGIDPAHRAEVFASFRRIDRSVTPLYGASGIGLHLAKHAIEESREPFELGSRDRSSAPTAPAA
ncbi:MAG: ATP-binding protein [Actinomycetota bacterium]